MQRYFLGSSRLHTYGPTSPKLRLCVLVVCRSDLENDDEWKVSSLSYSPGETPDKGHPETVSAVWVLHLHTLAAEAWARASLAEPSGLDVNSWLLCFLGIGELVCGP